MSYLDRLKQKISQDMPRGRATKATKGAFVPFVATRSAPSRQNLSREAVSQAGGHVTADDCDLVLKAARPLPDDLLAELKAHKPDLLGALTQPANLDTLLAEACQGVEGIDAATFRALLSPVDVEDIEGGHIPVEILRAYAESFAGGICVGRIKVLAAVIHKAEAGRRGW